MKSHAPKSPDWTTLAWAGWRMRIPADWRPLEIIGGMDKGKMIVGDADAAVLQIKWSRPDDRKRFDPRKWAAKRMGDSAAGGPAPEGFRVLGWQPKAKAGRAAKGATRSVWAGWSSQGKLLLEVVAWTEDRPKLGATIRNNVLPSLRAHPSPSQGERPSHPSPSEGEGALIDWSVFQVSFRTPPRFEVAERRFQPGHMAILFRARGGERLLLRQAYPRAAALARRDLAGWLRSEPFGQRRRFYPAGEAESWSAESFGQELHGLIRFGRRKLPAPLGWAAPRWTVRAIVEDERLDRLLLVEHEARAQIDETLVAESIAAMNWAVLE